MDDPDFNFHQYEAVEVGQVACVIVPIYDVVSTNFELKGILLGRERPTKMMRTK